MSRTVVAVVSAYTVPDIGGVEAYGARVARALRDSDRYAPVIVAASPDRHDHHLEVDGVPVHRLGIRGRVSNTPINPDWWWRLRGLLDELDVGLVNVHAPVPGLPDAAQWASRRRRPVVTTFHSGDMLKGEHHGIDLVLRMYQSLWLPSMFRRSDAVISSSSVALSHRWRGEDTIVSPGVDVEQFRPLGLERDASLLYVGRLERSSAWKGVHVLVDAMPEVLRARPDAQLRLAGHGDAVPDLQERARRLGVADHVDFLGPKSHAELVEVYNRAGALVLPSLTEAESFGMTLVEAMACETPVVGSRIGGIPTVVREGVDGLLATPGDASSLAAACSRVLTDPALAARLGAAGRAAAVDHWAWDNAMARTLAVFDGVLAARGAAPRRTRSVARA